MYSLYRFKNVKDEVVYVGKSRDINDRMRGHFQREGSLSQLEYESVCKVEYAKITTRIDMDIMELHLINKWKPKFNTTGNYGEVSNLSIDYELTWLELMNKKEIDHLMKTKINRNERYIFSDEINEEHLKTLSQFNNEKDLRCAVDSFISENNKLLNKTDIQMLRSLLNHAKDITGVAFKSKYELAEELNRVRKTVIRICNKLEGMGIIKQVRMQRVDKGGNSANAIVFLKKQN